MRAVFAGLLLLAVAETAIADPFADGVAALDRRDYTNALQLLRPLAENGNLDAQIYLANMYFDGNGVPLDYAEAVKWYLAAADRGSVDAQIALGFLYEYGDAVPQDYVQAHKWFDLAGAPLYRDAVAAKMTQAQIGQAQQLTKEWKPK
jgi:TPR repeat protein